MAEHPQSHCDVQESTRLAITLIAQRAHVLDQTLGEFSRADLAVAVGIERRVLEHCGDLSRDFPKLVPHRREPRLEFGYCCASRIVLAEVCLDECVEPLFAGLCFAGNLRGDGDVVAIAACVFRLGEVPSMRHSIFLGERRLVVMDRHCRCLGAQSDGGNDGGGNREKAHSDVCCLSY